MKRSRSAASQAPATLRQAENGVSVRSGTIPSALGAVLVQGTSMLIAACGSDVPSKADHTNAELVAQGQDLYQQYCASCHGAELEGQHDWRTRKPTGALPALPHDESGHTWHHPDQLLFEMTKFGVKPFATAHWVSDMPAFAGVLSDEQI